MLNIFRNKEDNRIIKAITKNVNKEAVKSLNKYDSFGNKRTIEFIIDSYHILICREKSWLRIGNIPIPPSDVGNDYKISITDLNLQSSAYEIKCSYLNAKRLYKEVDKICNLAAVDKKAIEFKKNLLDHFAKSEIRDDKLKKLL